MKSFSRNISGREFVFEPLQMEDEWGYLVTIPGERSFEMELDDDGNWAIVTRVTREILELVSQLDQAIDAANA